MHEFLTPENIAQEIISVKFKDNSQFSCLPEGTEGDLPAVVSDASVREGEGISESDNHRNR